MTFGPLGVIGSVAGSPLSQAKGNEVDRAQQDAANQTRETKNDQRAEQAAGIGETEQDEGASDRDADGRRLWEDPSGDKQTSTDEDQEQQHPPQSKDPTGQSGQHLDLSG